MEVKPETLREIALSDFDCLQDDISENDENENIGRETCDSEDSQGKSDTSHLPEGPKRA
jgi:hypothetical protein